ncbi:hypothetical protein I79_021366 [Cricetulus griseus]|uniref:Uncharacterized protein n=1 Tax=Cricetulus griseus TaxID=10029 RepID=G3ICG8_CRIGR|nr:hypothetical protein I79_021366 [Cricetulus griseus]
MNKEYGILTMNIVTYAPTAGASQASSSQQKGSYEKESHVPESKFSVTTKGRSH